MFPEDVEAQFNKKIEAEEEKKKKAMETIATHHVVMNVTESKYIEE
jgi:hypothetical protein